MSMRPLLLLMLFLSSIAALPAYGQDADSDVITMDRALVLERVGVFGRQAIQSDPILGSIADGSWMVPAEGDVIESLDGTERTWQWADVNENGWLQHRAMRGGYALWTIDVDEPTSMILHARGHSAVRVNEAWRTGDPYNTGFVRLPIALQAGTNTLLFHVSRGRVRAALHPVTGDVQFNRGDQTLPDVLIGEDEPLHAGVIVMNTTDAIVRGLQVVYSDERTDHAHSADVPALPPHSMLKVPCTLPAAYGDEGDERACTLTIIGADGAALDELSCALRVRHPEQKHVRTFLSNIDGSVQYYAVTPAAPVDDTKVDGLILTLHGASVQARRQANSYEHKSWCHIVAPTNRRPFGFDWEDWGRLDAMEVLNIAQRKYRINPDRTWLTGHSMGGHGTWNLGATHPDRFAALAPSAGWISFWSYVGGTRYADDDGIEGMMRRATNASDTLALSDNYLQHGIYILHGDADDNVPVGQARQMREHLSTYHPDFAYYERPGASHWWGNQCMDWPELTEFLRRRTRQTGDSFSVTTASPAVSSRCRWISIESQHVPWEFSRMDVALDRGANTLTLKTENIQRCSVDVQAIREGGDVDHAALTMSIDGQNVDLGDMGSAMSRWWFANDGDQWVRTGAPDPDMKTPMRGGAFKDVFRNDVVLVYGTRGRADVRAWCYQKARFDAETFWYRGNGALELVADHDFEPEEYEGRNVVLYGNTRTNSAWGRLLQHSPVHIGRGGIRIGDQWHERAGVGAMFLHPRDNDPRCSIGAVGGTSIEGMRLMDRLPYFVSGVGYPDLFVVDQRLHTDGIGGVWCTGFFGNDWSVEHGDIVWRED